MTVEADTARILRAAAADLRVQDAVVEPHEVGFRRYAGPDGSTIGLSLTRFRGRPKLVIQWRQRPLTRELQIDDPMGLETIDDVASAAAALKRVAEALDETPTQTRRPRDRAALELCAAIASTWACLRGAPGFIGMDTVRIWGATSISPPILRVGRPHGAVEAVLSQFAEGYRTTRAGMVLQPGSSTSLPNERFLLSGKMDMVRIGGGGVVEAMRQVAIARKLAHPQLRPADRIEAALREAGA